MNTLIVHGCYDATTLNTLLDLGVKDFAFDLRGRSQNLIPFKTLSELLNHLNTSRVFLTFENDRQETIEAGLNLLKFWKGKLVLIFRDQQESSFYAGLKEPFFWMFHPAADYKSILQLENIQGILLPLKWQEQYQKLPDLWKIIDEKQMDVYLHAENFEEALNLNLDHDLKFSLDLGSEIESEYRKVDQAKLRGMKFGRKMK
ncbi:MAG: hypothetical protein NDI69_00630 [Bacteriovoracaceae bacterium]|nr:hypothetical protein [Bacteriovoracaceae bacterium]